ncbi:MAG: hypothetical protein A2X56_06760 [Nitrospirae bacterium GWC2_57_13]|jgi:hypothetical protein|nr:MAG: hypothetical protein A2X56_06760 [Nitrospirae bacterium GWC2_57_13]HAR46427.1 hypothetical protein [Nitrospiraceae bacterium]
MNANTGWIEKELLETFYHIVEEFRSGMIDQEGFTDRIVTLAERYGRLSGKEESSRNQMSLFTA